MPSVAISIIAYNEAPRLDGVIAGSVAVLEGLGLDYEVLVVDDGSEDGTGRIIQEWRARQPRVRALRHDANQGLGPTVRDALLGPSKELVYLLPGDHQISPQTLRALLPEMERADVVLGWRRDRRDSGIRRALSALYNRVISWRLGRRVHDVDSAVLVRREAIARLPLAARTAFVHAELLLEANRAGLRWVEVPIEHRPRTGGPSRAFKPRVMAASLAELFRYLRR